MSARIEKVLAVIAEQDQPERPYDAKGASPASAGGCKEESQSFPRVEAGSVWHGEVRLGFYVVRWLHGEEDMGKAEDLGEIESNFLGN